MQMWYYENWRGKGDASAQRKKGYYAKPCPELQLRNENEFASTTIHPLKNGGSVLLKPPKVRGFTISLANTCAFDSLVHLLTVAYADSAAMRDHVDRSQSPFFQLAASIAKQGVKASSYKIRAEILYDSLPDQHKKKMPFEVVNVDCAMTPDALLRIIRSPPSIIDKVECSSQYCPGAQDRRIAYILLGLTSEDLVNLEPLLIHSVSSESITDCNVAFSTDQLESVPKDSQYVSNYPINEEYSKFARCGGKLSHHSELQTHLFVSLAGTESVLSANDIGGTENNIQCNLSAIPATILLKNSIYHLRGIIAFQPPLLTLRSTFKRAGIGHYVAYCRRTGGHWYLLDDLRDKQQIAKDPKVTVSMILYSL